MKIATITGVRRAELAERPEAHAQDDFVLVKVLVAPMCTEYKLFRQGQLSDHLGHEAAGEVLAVDAASMVRVGDRVVVMPISACGRCALCRSGDYIHCQQTIDVERRTANHSATATYAQMLVKQDWMLLPLPDDISLEHGSMACCGLGPTFGAMQRMQVDAFDTVLITGMGPVGLGGVINGVQRGARVIAVESHPYRQQLAADLGAVAVIDPADDALSARILGLTGGRGADKAIDCTGVAQAQRLLIDSVRRRGQVAFVGEGGALEIQVSQEMIRKGLTLHGSWHWNLVDAARMIHLIRQTRSQIDKLITHSFQLSQVQDAFELQLTGNCGKVLLKPWE